jgi:hypothetical protein
VCQCGAWVFREVCELVLLIVLGIVLGVSGEVVNSRLRVGGELIESTSGCIYR